MARITKEDEKMFLKLFYRDGNVLNLGVDNFNKLTKESIGEKLYGKNNLSKGKCLKEYLRTASDENKIKLIYALFNYYEDNMEFEYKDNPPFSADLIRYNKEYASIYKQCKTIKEKLENENSAMECTANNLITKFSSNYIEQQIKSMFSDLSTNPTNAIGTAKELIESCCKSILEELNIEFNKEEKVHQLVKKTMNVLDLMPNTLEKTMEETKLIEGLLGNLTAIPTKLSEIRNVFGSGHGKSASFKGLEERHARLAVDSSITFVNFIWSTFENQKHT